jgi:hypothetical protein
VVVLVVVVVVVIVLLVIVVVVLVVVVLVVVGTGGRVGTLQTAPSTAVLSHDNPGQQQAKSGMQGAPSGTQHSPSVQGSPKSQNTPRFGAQTS